MNALRRRQAVNKAEKERLERLREQEELQRRLELLWQRLELIKRRRGQNGAT